MRTSALTAAIVVLTTLASSLTADDDFSALLADLTFTDAPSIDQHLSVAVEEPVVDLKPVPTGIRMPELLESSPPTSATTEFVPQVPGIELLESQPTPRVALQDPIPATDPAVTDTIDLNAAFAVQGAPTNPVDSQSVSHQLAGCRMHGCQTARCESPAPRGPSVTCRPRTKPNLPSSTFLQYFRSDACYTNVWDGYHRSCCKHHSHIHGTCDCFNKDRNCECGEVIDCAPAGCASCDGGCDQ